MINPARERGFYSGLAMVIPLLNHEGNNLRFNVLKPEPKTSVAFSRTASNNEASIFYPTTSPAKLNAVELEEDTIVSTKTARCLSPVM